MITIEMNTYTKEDMADLYRALSHGVLALRHFDGGNPVVEDALIKAAFEAYNKAMPNI